MIEAYADAEHDMVGAVVTPDAPTGAGAVVIGGSGGGTAVTVALARALAGAGVTALGLGFHGDGCRRATLRDVPLEGFVAAANAVRARCDRVTLIGLSRGSEAAMLVGARFPSACERVVGVVPGNVVACSWPPGHAAWLLDGAPLTHVSTSGPGCANPAALIPVERVAALLLISAGRDEIWPSGPMADAIVARRADHGLATEHVHVPDAGHLVLDPSRSDDPGWSALARFVTAG